MKCATSYCLVLLLAIIPVAPAETIQGLIDAGKLEARALVRTPAPHYQKAQVEIVVEVGTPDRFKNATRVRDFTVPLALVRRLTKSAFNETRRRDGVSWNFQSLRFGLHAERPGSLKVPLLKTLIAVETETDGVVEGELDLSVEALQIEVAPGTESLVSWVAANEFTVEETWEGVLKTHQLGDAVTRIRKFTIKGSPVMSIPSSPEIKLEGVDLYQAPSSVVDQEVGGKLEGVREERVVFTFKGGGTFSVPDDRFHWFNVLTGAVEQIELPGRKLEVSGPPAIPDVIEAEERGESEPTNLWPWLLAALGMGAAIFLMGKIRRPPWLSAVRSRVEGVRRDRHLKTEYMHAAQQGNSRACLALLYERMSEHGEWELGEACAHDAKLKAAAASLMAHAYGEGPAPEGGDFELLWTVSPSTKFQQKKENALQLNPGPSR